MVHVILHRKWHLHSWKDVLSSVNSKWYVHKEYIKKLWGVDYCLPNIFDYFEIVKVTTCACFFILDENWSSYARLSYYLNESVHFQLWKKKNVGHR